MIPLDVIPSDCSNCGACCYHLGVPPFSESELKNLSFELRDDIERYKKSDSYSEESCYWLSNGLCSHYENRPKICKDFPLGGRSCLIERRAHGIKSTLTGADIQSWTGDEFRRKVALALGWIDEEGESHSITTPTRRGDCL